MTSEEYCEEHWDDREPDDTCCACKGHGRQEIDGGRLSFRCPDCGGSGRQEDFTAPLGAQMEAMPQGICQPVRSGDHQERTH